MSNVITLGGSIVALAGIAVVIIYGDKSAKVVNEVGAQFVKAIRAATLR